MENIVTEKLKSNGFFGLIKGPFDQDQHPNQQKGLNKYIYMVNLCTGELCTKKLYQNTKGLHFKHSSGNRPMNKMKSTHYLSEFTSYVLYVPFQIIEVEE